LKRADTGNSQQELPLARKPEHSERHAKADDIYIEGVGNLLTQLAQCCQPVPGDDIRGYITVGRGVTVHRSDCDNLLHLEAMEPQRLLQVSWGNKPNSTYPVDMLIQAYDRTGLLRDVSSVLANERINVLSVNTQSNQGENTANMQLTVEVESLERFARLMSKIAQLPNVISARRVRGGHGS
ncbi:MAG: ACT domain-containing protein, partial [Gammaproteobacteria bacterium]|nr:ACT domain-containing protein [Gammaproteobacteria bacterium]